MYLDSSFKLFDGVLRSFTLVCVLSLSSSSLASGNQKSFKKVCGGVFSHVLQLAGANPFSGTEPIQRVPLFSPFSSRPSAPYPHPWNYGKPIEILATYFHGIPEDAQATTHTSYSVVPFLGPVLVTRDPQVIKQITLNTGDGEGQFDRDQLPSTGIARSTGADTMLFANGATWRNHRRQAAAPFGLTALFQEDVFKDFEATFRETLANRVAALKEHLLSTGKDTVDINLEPEINAVMLQMLVNNFMGARIPYDDIRDKYVPALERIIRHIVRDTVVNRLTFSTRKPGSVEDNRIYDELTDIVLEARREKRGMWHKFKTEASDEAIRSNVKVILAGALEATSSLGGWALSHIARNRAVQDKLFNSLHRVDSYTPENLASVPFLADVIDETLRLTPSLYFLPRKATIDTTVQTREGRSFTIPAGTHILLDIWHANRSEVFWGKDATGFSALEFAPWRWEIIRNSPNYKPKDWLHFGFGLGARICPGQHLAKLEVSLLIAAMIKVFEIEAIYPEVIAKAGVSTKPADGTHVRLRLRSP